MPLLTADELGRKVPFFRGRAGNALAKGLIHLFSVEKVNELYDRLSSYKGPEFASAVLDDIGMSIDVISPLELTALIPEGPFITISNHPCGHVDGIALVDIFGRLRPDYKVMVNQILSRVEPLKDNFITVAPVGKEREAPAAVSVCGVRAAMDHLRSGGALGLFPSGAVSDLNLKDRCVRDREWQEAVIRLIMKAGVPVLPVRFFDGNSALYYSLGLIDWKVRLIRLPAEVFNKKGRTMHIGIGNMIDVEEQRCFKGDTVAFRSFLRSRVYGMELPSDD